MSSKEVRSFDLFRSRRKNPIPDKWVLSFQTYDGWFYRYVSQQKGDPFEFKHKRRPDMTISRNEITPKSIRGYFQESPVFELVNEKLLYHGDYPD